MSTEISRRTFIKTLACGTAVTFSFSGLPINSPLAFENKTDLQQGPTWAPVPGKAKWRIDGLAKVLGQKIYARDFHARDMNGWPENERYLYALRVDRNNQIVDGYDLSILPDDLKPISVVDAEVIERDSMNLAGGMYKPYFAKYGSTADYCGQPVAMLIFENFRTYRKAKNILKLHDEVIKYGDLYSEPESKTYSPKSAYIRDDDKNFNYLDNEADYEDLYPEIAKSIENEIATNQWNLFERKFRTQSTDPMFMEPEAGLVWFNQENGELQIAVGTQSPSADIHNIAEIFDEENCRFKLSAIDLIACYPGGGFGGRDDSYFPRYLALCSPYANGPLRWASDRYEQFQVGLKRHNTDFSEQIAIDDSGIIRALTSSFILNGGGRRNLSPYVADLAALSAVNCYDINKVVSYGEARDTKDLLGGSQRGFGGPQASIAIETLLDEAALALKIDPFEIRRRNILDQNSKIITGAPVLQDLQLPMILDELEKQPLWQNRHTKKEELAKSGLKYGVGLALSNQAYGNKSDGMYGGIKINRDGEITVHTTYIDMGNGAATSLGLAPSKYLGRNADHINMGEIALFDKLGLSRSYEEYPNIFIHALTKFGLIDDETNGRYVKTGSSASSASLSAFHQHHAIEQAALTLLLQTIIPAASKIWDEEVSLEAVIWRDGKLTTRGQRDLSWMQIVEVIFSEDLPTLTTVHASYMSEFVTTDFEFSNTEIKLPLDFIAMGHSEDDLKALPRSNPIYPPEIINRYGRSTFTTCGALISVVIDEDSNQVQVEDSVSVLCAGKQLCPELIKGQSEGGLAMSIGYVLFENCPNKNDGPGNGLWNLDQYRIAAKADMPKQQKLIVLDPPDGETTARGIAEAVMCPLPAAILNALAMATNGHRFSRLPVTEENIKEVLS